MNVVLVLDRFDPQRGGLEGWTFHFARWLARQGCTVGAAAFEFSAQVRDSGIRCHQVPPAGGRLARAAEISGYIRDHIHADIVHDTGSGWHSDILHPQSGTHPGSLLCQLRNLPRPAALKLCVSRRWWQRYRELKAINSRQYTRAGTIIAVSDLVRSHMKRFFPCGRARIEVIHNGVDTDSFRPGADPAARRALREEWVAGDEPVFLQVAHNFELKGVDYALRALRRVMIATGLGRLVVVGGGAIDEYKHKAYRLGLRDRVHFTGTVADVAPYYHAADVCIHPALYDACSLTVLEAMACGLPVISSRFNGASELIEAGKQGFVFPEPRDVRQIAEHMLRLLDPAQRASFSTRARERAVRYNSETSYRRIIGVYEQVVNRPNA